MVKKAQRAARQAKRAKRAPAVVPNWQTPEFWDAFVKRILRDMRETRKDAAR